MNFYYQILLFLLLKVQFNNCKVDEHGGNKNTADKAVQQTTQIVADEKSDAAHHTDLSNKKEYARLLQTKRNEQTNAIKSLLQITDNNKKMALLTKFTTNIEETIEQSKNLIMNKGNSINFQQFPIDEVLREQVARIIENAILFGEISLYYPDFVQKYLKKRSQFYETYKWAHSFACNFSVYDKSTSEMMHLAAQELELIPRQADYINPYSFVAQKDEIERKALKNIEESNKKKKMDKNQKKKKPGLSNTEL